MRPGAVDFRCNVCSGRNRVALEELGRENASCAHCGSTVRMRAIVHLLATSLFGRSLALDEFPRKSGLRGVGLSDWAGYASRLEKIFDYTNTYYHQEPRLDITDIGEDIAGSCDFLVSTDVFEHVLPPVSRAFAGARRLLRPGGLLVLTVPFSTEPGDTAEHFPNLHDFRLEGTSAQGFRLRNRRQDGVEEVFDELVFHGGPGTTLEMRVFSRNGLERELQAAGFSEVRFHGEPCLEHGVWWQHPWSIPVTARA